MVHGRYTIVSKLADGGMAEIFLAMQKGAEGFQKPVVLKRILTAYSADPQFRNMFLDEAQISMGLTHGNIVQVLDVGVAGARTFLVLELVEGWDLARILERAQATGTEHPWPPSLAFYVAAQVCRALSYAHGKRAADGRPLGIVHRDVSPNNVLLSEQGEVKLADFGIAKAESKREQTLAGVIKGKIGFMSPEQALGRALDARADLFSVGALMYLMLTGRKPFEGASDLEAVLKAQRCDFRPPEELNPYLSAETIAVVRRGMKKDAADRYQTADQMLADVERVLRAEYHSAGQTELKAWLAELARRDGESPTGRMKAVEAEARPELVDASGELSAGTSVELSDIDGTAASAIAEVKVVAPQTHPPPRPKASVDATLEAPPATPGWAVLGARPSPPLPLPAVPSPPVPSSPPPSSPSPSPSLEALRGGAQAHGELGVPAGNQAGVTAAAPPTVPRASGRYGSRKSRVGLGFVLGAVCMLGAVFGIRWLAEWAGRDAVSISRLGSASSPPSPSPSSSSPSSSASAEEKGARPTVATGLPTVGPKADPKPDPITDPRKLAVAGDAAPRTGVAATETEAAPAEETSGPDAHAPAGASPPVEAKSGAKVAEAAGDMDDDEEHLLGRVAPGAAPVIGDDEAEEAPPAKKPGKPARAKAAAPAAAAGHGAHGSDADKSHAADKTPAAPTHAQPVAVRITTSPLGAVVRTKKQVLGRTPLALRFSPGNTYELIFVKSGYITDSRKLAVATGKPQSISVAMKKAPPPQHHGLLRGR